MKVRIISVSLDDDALVFRPLDAERRIVPAYAARMFRREILRHLVENFSVILEGLEAVGKFLRDVEHFTIRRGELDGKMLLEGWRGTPDVDNDVIDRSRCAPYKLCFRKRNSLVMHSSQSAFPFVERNVALHDLRVEPMRFKFPPAERAGKKPALVCVLIHFDHKGAGQIGLRKNQVSPVA